MGVNLQRIRVAALKFQTINQRHDRLTLSQILIRAELQPRKPRQKPPREARSIALLAQKLAEKSIKFVAGTLGIRLNALTNSAAY